MAHSPRGTPAESQKSQRSDPQFQAAVKNLESGMRHLQKQAFDKAQEAFEKVLESGPAEIQDRARVYLHICRRKLEPVTPAPKTSQEFYDMGVAELNNRQPERAIEYLNKADKAQPDREEVRYALAAAHALLGNTEPALEHLKAAISLRPENRFRARHDEDFQSLASDVRFKALLHSDGTTGARGSRRS